MVQKHNYTWSQLQDGKICLEINTKKTKTHLNASSPDGVCTATYCDVVYGRRHQILYINNTCTIRSALNPMIYASVGDFGNVGTFTGPSSELRRGVGRRPYNRIMLRRTDKPNGLPSQIIVIRVAIFCCFRERVSTSRLLTNPILRIGKKN